MFTPQEIQERAEGLEKAVFGGYSVSAVDELLTPLAEDYAALYKENAVLKSKMKVLVDKMEEYREREESINRALLTAQKSADDTVAQTQRRCAKMLSDYEQQLRARKQELDLELAGEQERVTMAKQAASRFIAEVEERVQAQLATLEKIKQMDLKTARQSPARQPAARRVPAQAPAAEPVPAPAAQAEPSAVDAPEEAVRQIEENLSKMFESEGGTQ